MPRRSFPLARVYGLLEPGPVVLLTTSKKGRPNVMTLSWHTMMEFEPPLIGCIVSNRNYSFNILKSTKECAINIPTATLAKSVVGCGNTSGKRVDKFKAFGLTPVAASSVEAPLIKECYANLECKVVDTTMVSKYNLFVLEVVKSWIDPSIKAPRTLHHRGNGRFVVSGRSLKLASRMR